MDLLPLYIDQMTSEETNKVIEEHLASCEECQKIYHEMGTNITLINHDKNSKEKAGKRIKKKMMIKRFLLIYVFILVVIIAFCLIDGFR